MTIMKEFINEGKSVDLGKSIQKIFAVDQYMYKENNKILQP